MASGSGESDVAEAGFSEELDAWLRQRADDLDVSRGELLAQLAGSYRLAVESDGDVAAALGTDAAAGVADERLERAAQAAVDERLDQLEQRVGRRIDELEAETDETIDEIHKRIVQLKNDVDSTADADHDHEALERVGSLADEIDELRESVASIRESGADDDRDEAIADLEERVTTVASAVVELREADGRDGAGESRRAALDELKRQAARVGVESADCDACGNEVNLALLTEPACPHCETELRDVTVSSGFLFDSATVGSGDGERGQTSKKGADSPGGGS